MFAFSRRRAPRAALPVLARALALGVGLGVTAGLGAPASATDVTVHHRLFGMQDSTVDSASLTRVQEGSERLWGVGVRWDQVETRKGHYDWTRLDQLVTAAQAAHVQVTMTVAMTPSFYASSPTDPPRSVAPYERFVRALMRRYRSFHGQRGIASYQVWNEVNIRTFWTGTTRQLADLTRATARARDAVDPAAAVVGPAMVTRLRFELAGIQAYYAYRLQGVPVWRYVDAVSLHLYPLARYGPRRGVPEDAVRLLAAARRRLHAAGVPSSKPIWNTEINYGLQSGPKAGTPADPIGKAAQASNVMRTYLLEAAHGVTRVFWYRYDLGHSGVPGTIGNTLLSEPGRPDELTAAGRAYVRAQQWMHGTMLGTKHHRPCLHDSRGTYTCVLRDASGTRRIYWNPFRRATVRLAGNARRLQGVLGGVRAVTPHSRLRVGPHPVMVTR